MVYGLSSAASRSASPLSEQLCCSESSKLPLSGYSFHTYFPDFPDLSSDSDAKFSEVTQSSLGLDAVTLGAAALAEVEEERSLELIEAQAGGPFVLEDQRDQWCIDKTR